MRLHLGILDADFVIARREKITYHKASLFKRFLNQVIDYMAIFHFSIFVGVLFGIFFVLIGREEWVDVFKNGYVSLGISWAVIFMYYFIGEFWLKGKTLGKFATKTTVKTISGGDPSMKNILIRSSLRLIPFEFITILFETRSKESLHDFFSSTMVVEDN